VWHAAVPKALRRSLWIREGKEKGKKGELPFFFPRVEGKGKGIGADLNEVEARRDLPRSLIHKK